MARTNRPNNARQREVNALAGNDCAFRRGSYGLLKLLETLFHASPKLIQQATDDGPKFGRGSLQPLFGDAIQDARFATEPGVTQRFPGRFVACGCVVALEFRAKCFETGGDLRSCGDTKRGEGLSSDVGYFGHGSRIRESLHQSKRPACGSQRTHFDASSFREMAIGQAGVPAACFAWA